MKTELLLYSNHRGILFHAYFLIDLLTYSGFFMFLSSTPHPVFFQALQKILFVDHIKRMAELLHANGIQQLEVALLGSPTVQIIDLLIAGMRQPASTSQRSAILPSKAYTSTPMAPPPPTIPIVGITNSLPITSVSSEGNEAMALDSQEISKCCCIVPTSIQPSESTSLPSSPPSSGLSNKSTSYPILIVPELAMPAEVQPKWLNQPGGGKEYRCQLCAFQHSNQDCMLTHIRKHLDITIGCPICS